MRLNPEIVMRISRLLLPLLLAPLPLLAQPASLVRDSELKAEPFADATTVTALKAKAKVDVGERRGGWYQAKSSDGKSGWLRLTSVLLSSTQGKGDSGFASTAQLLQTGRSGSTGVTAATGVRGLDSADVVNANPDSAAVAKLDALTLDRSETRRFAADGHLSAQQIDYLPAEEK
jgi:hypothetical protein